MGCHESMWQTSHCGDCRVPVLLNAGIASGHHSGPGRGPQCQGHVDWFQCSRGVQVGKISPFQHSATRVLSRKFCLEEGRGKFGQIHTVSKYTKIQTKNDLLLKISENN